MKVYSKIIHVMADGTVRDSIEGVVIPLNEKTE
ncbi:BOW99_gp33 family protein [Anaerosinus massiliensis]